MNTTETKAKHTAGEWKVCGGRAIEARAFDGSWKWIADKIRGGSPDEAAANCGHILKYHADKYACEVEQGDGYRIGSEILEALGPCGCDCLESPDLLPLLAAIRKAKGEV